MRGSKADSSVQFNPTSSRYRSQHQVNISDHIVVSDSQYTVFQRFNIRLSFRVVVCSPAMRIAIKFDDKLVLIEQLARSFSIGDTEAF